MRLISKYNLFVTVLLLVFFASCSRKILYISDIGADNEILKTQYQPYHLKPYDYLYISIKTTDQDVNSMFSEFLQTVNIRSSGLSQPNYYLTGYMINDSGYIYLPIFGMLYAEGKTVEEFQNELQQTVNKILADAVVNVKLISYDVYFVGEVNTRVTFYKDRVNIFEAISQIGGLPQSADKHRVYVLRRSDSSYRVITLDLTRKNIFDNKNFYLQPNDIVYVRPRPVSLAKIQIQDYFIFVSLVSSTLSLTTFLITLLLTRQ